MRKNKVRRGVLAIILLVVAVFFIAGTYSRYSTQGKVDLTTNVAKWNVAIKKGETALTETTQDIAFTVTNDEFTVDNKIAPNTSASATLDLYLAGTEVAVDFDAVIDQTALSAAGLNNAKIKLKTTADTEAAQNSDYTSGNSILFNLPDGNAFNTTNGTKHVILTLTWENSDDNNVADTKNGIDANTNSEVRIPVTLTAKQHIAPAPAGE